MCRKRFKCKAKIIKHIYAFVWKTFQMQGGKHYSHSIYSVVMCAENVSNVKLKS